MSAKEHQADVIEMLANNEEMLSRLYKAYAKKFPEHKDFWAKLASEELGHAKWVRRLHSGVDQDEVYFKEGKFRKKAIQNFSTYLKERLAAIRTREMSLVNALSIALDVENAYIESKIFKVFKADHKELKHLLKNLDKGTRDHRDRIRKLWETKRRGS